MKILNRALHLLTLGTAITFGAEHESSIEKVDLPRLPKPVTQKAASPFFLPQGFQTIAYGRADTPYTLPQKEKSEISFDFKKAEKLVKDLDSRFYKIRSNATQKLLEMPRYDLLSFTLAEVNKPYTLEVLRRLYKIQEDTLNNLREESYKEASSPKRKDVALKLIELMDNNRYWKSLTPEVVKIITHEAITNYRYKRISEYDGRYEELKLNEDLISPISKLLSRRYWNDPKHLKSVIELAQHISELDKANIEFHKSYAQFLEYQVDNLAFQKHTTKKDIQETLVSALIKELNSITYSGVDLRNPVSVPLVKAYTKLVKQKDFDLQTSLDALVDFQYFTSMYIDAPIREKLHPALLRFFDTISEKINKLHSPKEKAFYRNQLVFALPQIYAYSDTSTDYWKARNKVSNLICRDYVKKMSDFYCKQIEINTDEFISLTDSLLSLDSNEVGKYISTGLMLQFIEDSPKYFEKNINHIIDTYKNSNNPDITSNAKRQLKKLNTAFQNLFKVYKDPNKDNRYIIQYIYPNSTIMGTTISRSNGADTRPDWVAQIQRIEAWFNQTLERRMTEIVRS